MMNKKLNICFPGFWNLSSFVSLSYFITRVFCTVFKMLLCLIVSVSYLQHNCDVMFLNIRQHM